MSEEKTPQNVMFRVHSGEVTAILWSPGEPTFNARGEATCYAHAGQHSTCSRGWYYETRKATEAEAAPLKRELENIGYMLTVRSRVSR